MFYLAESVGRDMAEKPEKIYWNPDFETYEAIYPDGYILPLRSDIDAEKLAKQFGMEVIHETPAP